MGPAQPLRHSEKIMNNFFQKGPKKKGHYPPAYGGNGRDPKYTYIENQKLGSFWSFRSIISSWGNHRTSNGLGLGLDLPLLR